MKIDTFIICDDIRFESGNKHSLMGVYDDKIIFNVTPDKKDSWPKQMRIGIFSRIDLQDDQPCSFNIKIKYNENENLIAQGEIKKSKQDDSNRFSVAIVSYNFLFKEKGSIKYFFNFFDKNKKRISSLSPDFDIKVIEKIIE